MSKKWDNIRCGMTAGGGLFIGSGKIQPNGTIKWESRSLDRTEEMVNMVARHMRKQARDEGKEYFGYEVENVGTIFFLKQGYEFKIRKIPPKNAPVDLNDLDSVYIH